MPSSIDENLVVNGADLEYMGGGGEGVRDIYKPIESQDLLNIIGYEINTYTTDNDDFDDTIDFTFIIASDLELQPIIVITLSLENLPALINATYKGNSVSPTQDLKFHDSISGVTKIGNYTITIALIIDSEIVVSEGHGYFELYPFNYDREGISSSSVIHTSTDAVFKIPFPIISVMISLTFVCNLTAISRKKAKLFS